MWVCIYECGHPQEPEKGCQIPGAGIGGVCEPPNLDPGKQTKNVLVQHVLLISEPSPVPSRPFAILLCFRLKFCHG